jgi:bacillithiol system protein YtxJ
MANHFVKFTDAGMLDEMAIRSRETPVVIFKHSLTCPISSAAYTEMQGFDGDVALLEIQRSRALSREVEDRLGVAHESPQVIILKDGQVVWNASHFSITAAAVANAIRELAAGEQ